MKILGRLLCLIGAELKVLLIIALPRLNVFTEFSSGSNHVTANSSLSTPSGVVSQLRPLDEHRSPVFPSTSNILSSATMNGVFPRIRCTSSTYLVKVCRLAFDSEDPTTVSLAPSKLRVRPDYSNSTRYCQANVFSVIDITHERIDSTLCHQHDKPIPKYPAFILLPAIFICCFLVSFLTYRFGWLFINWVFLSPIAWALYLNYSTLPSDIVRLTLLAYVLYPDYVSLSLSELCTLLLHCLSLLSAVQNIPGEILEHAINVVSRRALELAFFALVQTLLCIDKLLSVDVTKIRLKTREVRYFIERRQKRVTLTASASSGEVATLYATPAKRSEVRDGLVAQSKSDSDISAIGPVIPMCENDDVFRSNGASLKPAGSDDMLADSPIFKSSDSILRIEIPKPILPASQSDNLPNSEAEYTSCLRSSSPSPVSKNGRDALTIHSLVPSDSISVLTNDIPVPFSRTSSPIPSNNIDALAACTINSLPGSTSFRPLADVVMAGNVMCSVSRSASLVALAEVIMVAEPNMFSSNASLLAMSRSDVHSTSDIPISIVQSTSVISVTGSSTQDDSYYDANGSLVAASGSCALPPSVSASFPFSRGNSPIPCTRTLTEMSVPVPEDDGSVTWARTNNSSRVSISPAITSPPRARSANITDVLSPGSRSHRNSSSTASSDWSSGSSRLGTPGRVRYEAVRAILRKGVQDVFVAECTKTGSQVIMRTALRDTPERKNLLHEVMTLRQVRDSPWFPTLIDKFSEGGESKFVTTYYQRGSLAAHILKMGGFLSHECARFYLAEIMLALETLHSRGVVHHDINLQNLLLTDDGHIIISNFSQSTRNHFILNTKRKRRRTVRFDEGPLNHEVTEKAIERAIDNGDDDFYQMALAYHQMITGVKVKFTEPLVHEDIKCRREHMQDMGDVDISFLEMVLDRYPFECASLPELLTHPIFEHLDLTAMRDQSVPVPDMQCRQVRSSRDKTASPRSPSLPPAPPSTTVMSPRFSATRTAYSPPEHTFPSLATALSPHLRAARSPAHLAGGGAPCSSLTPMPPSSPPSMPRLPRKYSSVDWLEESQFLKIPPLPHEEDSPVPVPQFEMPSRFAYSDDDYGDN